jgi:hypothetical protein
VLVRREDQHDARARTSKKQIERNAKNDRKKRRRRRCAALVASSLPLSLSLASCSSGECLHLEARGAGAWAAGVLLGGVCVCVSGPLLSVYPFAPPRGERTPPLLPKRESERARAARPRLLLLSAAAAAAQREHEVQHAAGLDVELLGLLVVGELLAAEDEPLLRGRDACVVFGWRRRGRVFGVRNRKQPQPSLYGGEREATSAPSTCSMRSLMRSTLSLGSMSSSSVLPVSVLTLIIIFAASLSSFSSGRGTAAAAAKRKKALLLSAFLPLGGLARGSLGDALCVVDVF